MGREIKGHPMPMSELTPKAGHVVVEGKVFKFDCHETRRAGVLAGAIEMTTTRARSSCASMLESARRRKGSATAFRPVCGCASRGTHGVVSYDGKDMQLNPQDIMQIDHAELAMLRGAPKLEDALHAFLAFAGGRPLAAHNAEFDISFIRAGCKKCGIPFEPTYLDSLIFAQNLLPELGKYKLDIVADHLQLPQFNHHRASDDAVPVAQMLAKFFVMLEERGVTRLQQINDEMTKLRPLGVKRNRFPKHIILIAKNKVGLKNLYQLISASNLKYFKRVPIIPKSELVAHREGLIIGSACEAGELFRAIVDHKDWNELKRIASFYDYLEIQPLGNNRFMVRDGTVRDDEDLKDFNRTVVKLGEELGKPVCATGDVHFLDPEDEVYRHILLASKKFADANEPVPLYFRTTDEMLKEFDYLGKEKAYEVVVTNTRAIAEQVEDIELLPKGKLFPPRLENSEEDLNRMVWGKAHELYGDDLPQLIVDRLNVELGSILGKYDVVYMSAQKLVQRSLECGYLVGSRGSVGSSLVAYMSGITEVNSLPPHYRCPKCRNVEFHAGEYGCGADMPDKMCPVCGTKYVKDGFDIPFETFLGFGGGKVPDIDLNFSGEYQARAHAPRHRNVRRNTGVPRGHHRHAGGKDCLRLCQISGGKRHRRGQRRDRPPDGGLRRRAPHDGPAPRRLGRRAGRSGDRGFLPRAAPGRRGGQRHHHHAL